MVKSKILFLCTHNSARSIIAEAIGNSLFSDSIQCFSAGTEQTKVRELTIKVLKEISVPTDYLASKHLNIFLQDNFDFLVTVCDDANEKCPVFFGAKKIIHWSLPDPSKSTGTKEERLSAFRHVRDDIKTRIENLVEKQILSIS